MQYKPCFTSLVFILEQWSTVRLGVCISGKKCLTTIGGHKLKVLACTHGVLIQVYSLMKTCGIEGIAIFAS